MESFLNSLMFWFIVIMTVIGCFAWCGILTYREIRKRQEGGNDIHSPHHAS